MEECKIQQMQLRQFKEYFGIDEQTVKRWIHKKAFPAYKQGGKLVC